MRGKKHFSRMLARREHSGTVVILILLLSELVLWQLAAGDVGRFIGRWTFRVESGWMTSYLCPSALEKPRIPIAKKWLVPLPPPNCLVPGIESSHQILVLRIS